MIDPRTAPYAALVLRLALGAMFLAHGLLKLLVFTMPGTVGFFDSLGLPAVFAYLTVIGEIGGGVLLVLGVFTRWIAIAVLPILLGALFLVHAANGWQVGNGGWEYVGFLTAAAVAQALLGDGAFALRLPGSARLERSPA